MTAQLWLSQAATLPAPAELASYLRSKQWSFVELRSNWAIYRRGAPEDEVTIEVPQLAAAGDYGRSVSVLLEDLSTIESRPPAMILRDVRAATVDTIRVALEGTAMRDGRISISDGARAFDGARNLVLAAACSVLDRRLVHAKRKPDAAMALIDRARFGQTEIGSFVMTIEASVAPRLQGTLLEDDDFDAPLERKTSVLLATALQATQSALQESTATGSIEPFRSRAALGVSANLCDAVVELLHGSGAERLKTSFSFAAHRPLHHPAPSMVAFTADAAQVLTEASSALRAQASFPAYVLVGTIVALSSRDPSAGGTITVRGDVEGQLKNVRITLPATDYPRAIQAHQDVALVAIVGDLVAEGRTLTLQNAHGLSVLAEEAPP